MPIVVEALAPSAVVVGMCTHGLAIARSLSRAGVRVIALESNDALAGTRTRYAQVNIVNEITGYALIEALIALSEQLGETDRPVLFPTNDNMVKTLAEASEQLAQHYRLSWRDSADMVLALQQKKTIVDFCHRANLNHPSSFIVDGESSIDVIPASVAYPLLIKPNRPLSAFKAIRLNTKDELLHCLSKYSTDGPFVVQQWIAGGAQSLIFCAVYLEQGKVLASFTGRKREAMPPDTGQAVAVEAIRDDQALQLTEKFFANTSLSGPAALEFKRDDSGNYWIIEPNVGRTEYLLSCCIEDGVNLPLLQYCALTESPLPQMRQGYSTAWYDTERNISVYLRHVIADKSLKPGGNKANFPYWYLTDPGPLLKNGAIQLGRLFRAANRRLAQFPTYLKTLIYFLRGGGESAQEYPPGYSLQTYCSLMELPEEALDILDSGPTGMVFGKAFWYRAFEQQVLATAKSKPLYLVVQQNNIAVVVLPLMTVQVGTLKILGINSLGNYYTSLFSPAISKKFQQEDTVNQVACFKYIALSLISLFPKVARITFRPLDADAAITQALESGFHQGGFECEKNSAFVNWSQDVHGLDHEKYLSQRPPFLRSLLKRKMRKLEREHSVKIAIYTDSDGLSDAFTAFEAVYRKSWKPSEPYPQFIREICRSQAERGLLRLGILYVDGVPAAGQIWFLDAGVAAVFKLAYDPDYSQYSVGNLLLNDIIRHLLDVDKVKNLDMLEGDDTYKKDWVSLRRERIALECVNSRSLWGRMILLKHHLWHSDKSLG